MTVPKRRTDGDVFSAFASNPPGRRRQESTGRAHSSPYGRWRAGVRAQRLSSVNVLRRPWIFNNVSGRRRARHPDANTTPCIAPGSRAATRPPTISRSNARADGDIRGTVRGAGRRRGTDSHARSGARARACVLVEPRRSPRPPDAAGGVGLRWDVKGVVERVAADGGGPPCRRTSSVWSSAAPGPSACWSRPPTLPRSPTVLDGAARDAADGRAHGTEGARDCGSRARKAGARHRRDRRRGTDGDPARARAAPTSPPRTRPCRLARGAPPPRRRRGRHGHRRRLRP